MANPSVSEWLQTANDEELISSGHSVVSGNNASTVRSSELENLRPKGSVIMNNGAENNEENVAMEELENLEQEPSTISEEWRSFGGTGTDSNQN